jgi:methyl-accepting chemotaxis protein
MYRKFIELTDAQKIYFDLFSKFANPEELEFYRSKMSDHAIAEVQRLRGIADANFLTGGFGVDPTYWFSQKTTEINLMKEVEDRISQDLLVQAGNARSAASHSFWMLMIAGFSFIALAIILGIYVINGITKPLKKTIAILKDMAEGDGDLTQRLDDSSHDEVGEMGRWFNIFMESLQGIIRQITSHAGTLNEASGSLAELSNELAKGSQQMNEKSNSVAAATEEMSVNMNNVSAAVTEATSTMDAVASSTQEMTTTISEVAGNAERGRNVASEAMASVKNASQMVDELGSAADDIDKVIEVIVEIAEQTKLLALNATIEAARAGEAGKGFAVVANEVKDLAKQTNDATEDIRAKIEAMQSSTIRTVSEIREISTVMEKVNDLVVNIAAAMEEQSVITQDISTNISQAVEGIREISNNVGQAADVSGMIAGDITTVNASSSEILQASEAVNNSASSIKQMGRELKELVDRFKL